MGLPWREFTIASGVAAYFLAWRNETGTKGAAIATFCLSWTALFLGWAIWTVFLYPKLFSPLRDLPEPKNVSWWNGQYPRIAKETNGAPAREWINTIPNDGLIRFLGLLNQERLFITSPKALAEVLVTKNYEFTKPKQMRFLLARVLGEGILLAEGDEHKFQRRNLMPAFSFRHVKDLYPIFWDKARESIEVMTEQINADAARDPSRGGQDAERGGTAAKSAVLEITSWASRLTLDIIGVAGLGRDFGALRDPSNRLNVVYSTLFKPNKQAQLLGLAAVFLPEWAVANIPLKRNRDIYAARAHIREVCHSLVREKKDRLARKELADVDILSVALESGQFSDDNLVDQLMTFLAAGHETTAAAMTWAVYIFCVHRDVQARLRAEVRARLPPPGPGGAISSLDVDHMPYLNAVCSEVLRCWCPVPTTLREAAHDTSIQGHFVPKGTRVMIYPWALNYSVEMWGPDALKFDPERWMPGSSSSSSSSSGKAGGDESKASAASGGASSNYAFMTFLHGPRSCIGSGFARAEFACLLAAWVGRFAFALGDEEMANESRLEIKGGVTARPAKGMPVRVTVLDGW